MTFTVGAWVAGICGVLAGAAGARISASESARARGWIDTALGGLAGAFLSLVAFGILSLLEGWTSFFHRRASPILPLAITIAFLVLWTGGTYLTHRHTRGHH